jgi:hypothetical protein
MAFRYSVKKLALAAVLAALLAFFPGSGRAADGDPYTQTMTYQVYGSGFNALSAQVKISYKKGNAYHIEMAAWTRGFLAALAPWSGSFATSGKQSGGKNLSRSHKSVSIWRDEPETKTYTFDNGKLMKLVINDNGKDKSPKKLEPELTANTTDFLSAILTMLEAVGDKKPCTGSADIYDGKRRYTVLFRDLGEEQLGATPYNIYDGAATKCETEVKPGPGKWPKKPRGWFSLQEQSRQKGSLPTLWVAKLDPRGPAIPIKIRVKTDYGTLLMHLSDYKIRNGTEAPE